jgi:glycolate oxidase FAD binding subunit
MVLAPGNEEELAEIIAAAAAESRPLRIIGSGSKAGLGRPATGEELSLRAFSGIVLYEPEELVLIAGAGTPLGEIEALLASNNQHLAFEPIDYGLLFGANSGAGQGTVGGLVASNASGPRRIKAGAARDHVLGFRCVTGRGEIVKSGGRVMKNVTGYDLSKLVAGSFGTLAALTQVTLKTLPAPETSQTLLLPGPDEQAGLLALRKVSGAPLEASALALLPKGAAPLGLGENAAAIRLEGPEISVAQRLEDLRALLKTFGGAVEILGGESSEKLWRSLRDAAPVAGLDGQIWRVSVAPSDGFALISALKESALPVLGYFYDWAGGLVWLCLEEAEDAHASALRAAIDRSGGHATLIRASAKTRAAVDVFHPQPPALKALSQRVKESFDPAHILERGRMRAEF